MPNIKSAIKRVSANARKAEYNKNKKSELKTVLKKTQTALEASAENVADSVKAAQVKLDKAVSLGLIHKNKAARKKSQFARHMNEAKKA